MLQKGMRKFLETNFEMNRLLWCQMVLVPLKTSLITKRRILQYERNNNNIFAIFINGNGYQFIKLQVESFVNYMVRDDTKRNGHCRLTTSPPLRAYPTMGLQIKLPLGSPYAAVYSE